MPIKSVSNLKKFRSGELSDIMKKFGIKGLSKSKQEKIDIIRDSVNWVQIKQSVSIPKRAPKVFSAAQLAAQKAFADRNRKGGSKRVISKQVVSKRVVSKKIDSSLKHLLDLFSESESTKQRILKMSSEQHKVISNRLSGLEGILDLDQLINLV